MFQSVHCGETLFYSLVRRLGIPHRWIGHGDENQYYNIGVIVGKVVSV
jgi:hypothetical protein